MNLQDSSAVPVVRAILLPVIMGRAALAFASGLADRTPVQAARPTRRNETGREFPTASVVWQEKCPCDPTLAHASRRGRFRLCLCGACTRACNVHTHVNARFSS